VWWERTRRLVETLARREPAWRRWAIWWHAKSTRAREGTRTAREPTLGTKAVLIRTAWTARAKGRIPPWRELSLWGEVGRLLLTLLVLWRAVLTRLSLLYLLRIRVSKGLAKA
jgi:hypothetical protein